MSNLTPFIPAYDLAGIQSAGELLFKSGYFADTKSAAQAVVKVMAGAELGIPPFAAMNGIHIIQGKPCLSAGVMAGKVKASGKYDFRVTVMTDDLVEIAFLEAGAEIGRSSFSRADAVKAKTQNLDKFSRNMLYARAMSNGVKWFCPDIFLGPVYVPEEMGATVNEVTGEVIDVPVQKPNGTQAQQPYSQPYKEERLDGTLIHPKVTDPATQRPAAAIYRHEDEDPEASFAPRSTASDVKNALLAKHLGSHKGWMVSRKLDPENRALSIYLLNRAYGRGHDESTPVWASRKELTENDWKTCDRELRKLKPAELAEWVREFTAETADAPRDDDPFHDIEPCPNCGLTDSCQCDPAEQHAAAEGARQSGTLDIDVPTTGEVPAAFTH